jgi:hypothetical protein
VSFLALVWLWLLVGFSQNLTLMARYIVHTNKAFTLVDQKKAQAIRTTSPRPFHPVLENSFTGEFSSPYSQKTLRKLPQLNDFARHRQSAKSPAICQIVTTPLTPNQRGDLLQRLCLRRPRKKAQP